MTVMEWLEIALGQKEADQTSLKLLVFHPPSMHQKKDARDQHTKTTPTNHILTHM